MRPPLSRQTQSPSPAMKSQSPSSSTVFNHRKRSKTQSKEALNPSFADLPSCLLEVIMSHLVLEDNIRASAACKSWREAALSVRVVEKHPWLMCFPKSGNLYELRDPLQWKSYTLELPELADSTVCYSRDGWLLMKRPISKEIFFFNPFSRELISLPKFELSSFLEITFSSSPTLENCVVVVLSCDRRITISTWHPGETEWITTTEHFLAGFGMHYMLSKLVYVNDRFYCFYCYKGIYGGLYSFDPSTRKWKSHGERDIGRLHRCDREGKGVYLAEKKGELFLILTSGNEKPMVYKLGSMNWVEMSDAEVDGLTFFLSAYNSEARKNLPWMRNSVYFSRFGYNRKRCVSYSFDESRYNPRHQGLNWRQRCPPQSLWIVPPNNVLDYF